ncbi:MAG: M20/M25/M40 family metallo-hydrolase, partial [Candidatus Odinarchaeia archaeon]
MDEVEFLKELIKIYSPHGNEETASEFIYGTLKKLGFNTVKTPIGNVIGQIGEGKPVIFLCGHMDTVKGELPFKVTDNKIYGRGAVDAKSPL